MTVPLRRAAAASAAGLLSLSGVTACTPEIRAVTGISVDGSGQRVAVLAWCATRPPDGILLFDAEADDHHPRHTEWDWPGHDYRVPDGARSPTAVPLSGFPPSRLPAGVVNFEMYAGADDNSFTSEEVRFRLEDLSGLRPGQVLVTESLDGGAQKNRTVTLDEFARRGADMC